MGRLKNFLTSENTTAYAGGTAMGMTINAVVFFVLGMPFSAGLMLALALLALLVFGINIALRRKAAQVQIDELAVTVENLTKALQPFINVSETERCEPSLLPQYRKVIEEMRANRRDVDPPDPETMKKRLKDYAPLPFLGGEYRRPTLEELQQPLPPREQFNTVFVTGTRDQNPDELKKGLGDVFPEYTKQPRAGKPMEMDPEFVKSLEKIAGENYEALKLIDKLKGFTCEKGSKQLQPEKEEDK